jgi:hypothetical protein
VLDAAAAAAGSASPTRDALRRALDRPAPEDRFNVVALGDGAPRALFPSSAPADLESLEEARRWVARLEAGGRGEAEGPAMPVLALGGDGRGRVDGGLPEPGTPAAFLMLAAALAAALGRLVTRER